MMYIDCISRAQVGRGDWGGENKRGGRVVYFYAQNPSRMDTPNTPKAVCGVRERASMVCMCLIVISDLITISQSARLWLEMRIIVSKQASQSAKRARRRHATRGEAAAAGP